MARINVVQLMGRNVSKEFQIRMIAEGDSEGQKANLVLNFVLECYDEEERKKYRLPVSVWGKELVMQCQHHMKENDLVYVQGELRYKFVYNKEKREMEKVYTSVKATTVEFVSKKMKNQELDHSINEVKLIGNLVEDPIYTDEGFVIAVDRLYPSKDLKVPNYKLTDYVTVVVKDKSVIKGDLKKGSMAIIDGKLMTRKIHDIPDNGKVNPRIVVGAKRIVGR